MSGRINQVKPIVWTSEDVQKAKKRAAEEEAEPQPAPKVPRKPAAPIAVYKDKRTPQYVEPTELMSQTLEAKLVALGYPIYDLPVALRRTINGPHSGKLALYMKNKFMTHVEDLNTIKVFEQWKLGDSSKPVDLLMFSEMLKSLHAMVINLQDENQILKTLMLNQTEEIRYLRNLLVPETTQPETMEEKDPEEF